MGVIKIKLADISISLNFRYDYTERLCKDYITDEKSEFSVSTSADEIDRECKLNPDGERSVAESVCLFRKIAEQMPLYKSFVFHGAAISYENGAYLFTGPSGTGKSTHIKLWHKYIGDDVDIINGDKPIIKFDDNGIFVCSTPWAGKEGWQKNRTLPLKAICIIKQSEINSVKSVEQRAYITELLKQIYMPVSAKSAEKTLELAEKLCTIPLYVLECDISENAVKTAFETMTGKKYNG